MTNQERSLISDTQARHYAKVYWISRHPLTDAQLSMIQMLWSKSPIHIEDMNFINGGAHYQLEQKDICKDDIVLGVFPSHILLNLLANGFTVGGFVNEPSARQRGKFLCHGLFLSEINKANGLDYDYVKCPIPLDKQEEGDLTPLGR